MCFIGHGTFGIITKPVWCNYFAVFGIGSKLAYQLMPIVGSADILMGIIMLVYPVRAVAAWLVIWGMVTAMLRPLSGEPFAEFIERAGNFGAPLALLLLCGGSSTFKGWFTLIKPDFVLSDKVKARLTLSLKAAAFLLLAGHGWLNLMGKNSLVQQYSTLGIEGAVRFAFVIGLLEIAVAVSVWVPALKHMLLALFIWKMLSELFYPHYEIVEFVERGGSYGVILALWLVQQAKSSRLSYNGNQQVSYH